MNYFSHNFLSVILLLFISFLAIESKENNKNNNFLYNEENITKYIKSNITIPVYPSSSLFYFIFNISSQGAMLVFIEYSKNCSLSKSISYSKIPYNFNYSDTDNLKNLKYSKPDSKPTVRKGNLTSMYNFIFRTDEKDQLAVLKVENLCSVKSELNILVNIFNNQDIANVVIIVLSIIVVLISFLVCACRKCLKCFQKLFE